MYDFRVSNFSSSDEKMCGTIGQSQNGPNLPESLSVEETFDPWFRQQGYPFLRVSRDGDRKMVTSLYVKFIGPYIQKFSLNVKRKLNIKIIQFIFLVPLSSFHNGFLHNFIYDSNL